MNRTVLIGALVVLIGAGGYYQFSYKPAQEAAAAAEAAAKAAADEAAAAEAAAAEAAAAEAAAAEAAAAEAAAAEEAAAGAAGDAASVLDPANFDAAAVNALIDASSLGADVKTSLKAAVDGAAGNPALVAGVLTQVKTALGL